MKADFEQTDHLMFLAGAVPVAAIIVPLGAIGLIAIRALRAISFFDFWAPDSLVHGDLKKPIAYSLKERAKNYGINLAKLVATVGAAVIAPLAILALPIAGLIAPKNVGAFEWNALGFFASDALCGFSFDTQLYAYSRSVE
jgi:hypothetical protein